MPTTCPAEHPIPKTEQADVQRCAVHLCQTTTLAGVSYAYNMPSSVGRPLDGGSVLSTNRQEALNPEQAIHATCPAEQPNPKTEQPYLYRRCSILAPIGNQTPRQSNHTSIEGCKALIAIGRRHCVQNRPCMQHAQHSTLNTNPT